MRALAMIALGATFDGNPRGFAGALDFSVTVLQTETVSVSDVGGAVVVTSTAPERTLVYEHIDAAPPVMVALND